MKRLTHSLLKLCVPLFVCMVFLHPLNLNAQNQKITLLGGEKTLASIFEEIEKQTKLTIAYNESSININQIKNIRIENKPLDEVMLAVLKGTNATYKLEGKQIVIVTTVTRASNQSGNKRYEGTIVDEDGTTLIGVNIAQKGSNIGTSTDVQGNFSIEVPEGTTLVFSYIGFISQEYKVGDKTNLQIILEENKQILDEVVVVGYGTQKKTNLTGAVNQVKMEEVLGDRPVIDTKTALQGSIPGLIITGGSQPGESRKINIGGVYSITDKDNIGSPLVLIDNVPGSLDLINPEDIETVSVLKDASSAAIYGARGAFGVILITTKRAKRGSRLSINYNANFALQKAINKPRSASVEQTLGVYSEWYDDGKYYAQSQDLEKWLGFVREYNQNPKAFHGKYPGSYFENGRFVPQGEDVYYYLTDNDPVNAVLDNYGFQHTHNLSSAGGSEKISYRVSVGLTDQDGPLITNKDTYNRTNLSSFINGDITPWLSQSVDINYSKAKRSYLENVGNIYSTSVPSFFPTGNMPLSKDLNGEQYPSNSPENTLRLTEPSKTKTEATRLFLRTSLHPFEGFEGIFEYTYDINYYDYKRYTKDAKMMMMEQGFSTLFATPTYYNYKQATALTAINLYGTYQKTLGAHYFKLMAGFNQESRDYELLKGDRVDMINPEMPSFSGATGIAKLTDEFKEYAIRSGFFRFNYNYKEKYLLEVNGRYDGSSKFPKEKRFGFFPSFSAGWHLTKEGFMAWSKNWFTELKPRASWGKLGNQAGVAEYGYLPSMDAVLSNWMADGNRPTTLNPPDLVRSNYSWEEVETLTLGLDIAMFRNRLTASFGWYTRDTKGMLAPGMELPGVVGADAPLQNAADLQTKGWELTVQWREKINDWRYSVGFNLFDAYSKITKYNNEAGLFYNSTSNTNYRKDMKLGEIWGYVTDGFYSVDDFEDTKNWKLKEGVVALNGYTPKPGDIKFKDLDDNNLISTGENTVYKPGDREIIGNSTARYQFGANASIGWKGFDLSILIQGVGKRDYWLGGDLMFGPTKHYGNVFSNQLDYWQAADWKNGDFTARNPNAFYPRIYDRNRNAESNYRTQTKYLSNAAYLRIKNITFSYSLPKSILGKVGLTAAKMYFSGENLFTKSKLPKGVDPERISWGYPFYATYSFGFSLTL